MGSSLLEYAVVFCFLLTILILLLIDFKKRGRKIAFAVTAILVILAVAGMIFLLGSRGSDQADAVESGQEASGLEETLGQAPKDEPAPNIAVNADYPSFLTYANETDGFALQYPQSLTPVDARIFAENTGITEKLIGFGLTKEQLDVGFDKTDVLLYDFENADNALVPVISCLCETGGTEMNLEEAAMIAESALGGLKLVDDDAKITIPARFVTIEGRLFALYRLEFFNGQTDCVMTGAYTMQNGRVLLAIQTVTPELLKTAEGDFLQVLASFTV